jgi:tetratricopeptide (TPR) repeat protein
MAKQRPTKSNPAQRPQQAPARKPSAAPKPSTQAPLTKAALWVGLLATVLGGLLYLNTLGHLYTLDDFSVIKENWVTKGGLKNLGIIFSSEYRYGSWNSPGSLYRPFSLAMFAFEWQLAPEKPFLMHFVNMLLYALTGWVLWVTWRRVLSAYPPVLAAIAVLLYMAHPVHTEVVANIKSRDEILAMLFGTLALYSIWQYLDNQRTKWIMAALLSYGVAMFSKESAITFLAIFPLTVWFFSGASLSQNLRIAALMLIPAGIFLLTRHQVLSKQAYAETYSILDNFIVGAKNPAERLASAFMMCWQYLKVLALPHPLVHDMGYPQMRVVTFSDWRALAGLLSYGGMFVWALLNLGKKHFLSYAILFYLVTFSLFSNVLVLIGTSYGERLLYIPSFGFTLALAWVFCKVFKINDLQEIWNPNGKGSLVWGVAGALLVLYSLKTVVRNNAWYDSASLYGADLPTSPNCAKLNYHNALEVTKNGLDEKTSTVKDRAQVEKGIAAYDRCIELYPDYHDAFGSRGLAYFRLAQMTNDMALYDKAFTDYQVALKHRPNDAKVLSNMGFIYFMRGQLDKAEEVYRNSVKYDPRFIDARRNLGAVLAMKKNFPAAIEQWQEGLKFEPNNATLLFYIGSAYRDMGQPEKATDWLERAYAIEPSLRK